jgi:ribosomal-protein-alanine N-acetyltransferase
MTWLIERVRSSAEIDDLRRVEQASFTNPWTRDMYVAEFGNPEVSFFLVARDDGRREVVGFCACWHVLDELHINNLAVLPEYRRRGIGSALIGRALEEGTRLGATRATLEVRRSNVEALRLYERWGFSVAGVRTRYYTNPQEDALLLWRQDLGRPAP